MTDGFVFERGLWTIDKDRGESLDYTASFARWLGDAGVIDSATVTAPGLTISGVQLVAGSTAVTFTAAGGTPGQEALVSVAITSGTRHRISTARFIIKRRP